VIFDEPGLSGWLRVAALVTETSRVTATGFGFGDGGSATKMPSLNRAGDFCNSLKMERLISITGTLAL